MSEFYIGFTSDRDPKSVLRHWGMKGMSWYKHKFGPWQKQAQYAAGQDDPDADPKNAASQEVNDYLDKNPKKAQIIEEKMTSYIYADRAYRAMMQDAFDEPWDDNEDIVDRKANTLEYTRQQCAKFNNETWQAIQADKTLNKIQKDNFGKLDIDDVIKDRISKKIDTEAKERLNNAKTKDLYDMNFLEAVQNEPFYNNKSKMLKEYEVYLYNPFAYWQKDLFDDPKNLTYHKGK